MRFSKCSRKPLRFLSFLLLLALIPYSFGCGSAKLQQQAGGQEATYRGNSQHTGVFDSREVNFPAAEKWKYSASKNGIYGAPAVANGLVFFGDLDGIFFALDAKSGEEKWKFKTTNIIHSSPTVSGGTVYIGGMDGYFYALDAQTGAENWSFRTAPAPLPPGENPSPLDIDHGVWSPPVMADGIIYFGTFGEQLYALNAATGEELWEFGLPEELRASPTVAGGVVYFRCGFSLFALDARTGEKKWEQTIQKGLRATPVVANGVVLYDDTFNLTAYAADTGALLWTSELGSGGGGDSGPAVQEGVAFTGNINGFYAVDVLTGKKKWENTTLKTGTAGEPPSIAGNSVYFVDQQAYIDQLDVQSGEVKGRFKLQDKFEPYWKTTTTMAIADGVIYLASMDGILYAIEGK